MRFTSSLIIALGTYAACTVAQLGANSSVMYQLSSDSEFAFILEEYLSLANNFGTNTGEVLRAASQIVPGDYDSWYAEFKYLADAIHTRAVTVNATRFPVSAREAYFRAASYYRAAYFFLHADPSDPRINTLWDAALADFNAATSLLPAPAQRFNLTAANFSVPVIYFPAQSSLSPTLGLSRRRFRSVETRHDRPEKLPTVIVGTGYDGSQEELYHVLGRSILDRGWNYLSYEGPGQPTVRRQQNLGFVPNWWDVISPVVDFLHARPDVDPSRIALVGFSFGGTLAPRAASREHRLSAVLTVDGLTDMQAAILAQLPAALAQLFTSGNASAFDAVMLDAMGDTAAPTQLRWLVAQGLWSFNTRSPFDWLTRLGEIVADAPVLANATCPVFVGEGENDSAAPGQAVQMAADLGNRSTYNLFRTDLGAGEHCQIGAEAQLAQVALDWLADVWDGVGLPGNITGDVY